MSKGKMGNFSPRKVFETSAIVFAFILLLADVTSTAELDESVVNCPEDEKNVSPCFCRPSMVTVVASEPEVICETGDLYRHVKNDSLALFIQNIRQLNNLTIGQYLNLARVRIAYSDLTTLDLSPLLWTQVDKLEIANNAQLKKLDFGQNAPLAKGKIKVSSLLIEENGSLDDEGIGQFFRFFDPQQMTDLEFFHNSLRGLDSDGKRLPEFLPGLSNFSNVKIASFPSNGIKYFGQGTFRKMTKLEKLDLSQNNIDVLDEDSLLIDSDVPAGSSPSSGNDSKTDLDVFYNLALEIDLSGNHLSENSIPANSGLERIKRWFKLDLSVNSFKTIPKVPFKAIFEADRKNQVTFYGNDLICDDKLKWLKTEGGKGIEKQVQDAHCKNNDSVSIFNSTLV